MRRGPFLALTAAGVLVPLGARGAVATLQPAEMLGDLREFARGVEEVGAEPFRTSSREAFVQAVAQAESVCSQPRTADEFFVALARAAASLNDGHVGVVGWTSRSAHDDAGGGEFPLRTAIDDDGSWIVLDDLSDEGGVEPGTVVARVDGHDARDVVALAMALQGGQNDALRRALARLLDALFLVAGPHAAGSPYEVELIDATGSRRVRRLAAVTSKARNERYAARNPPAGAYVDRGIVRGAALLDYNSCRDRAAFRTFLSGFFERARAANARAVVVDIRRNGGGDSSVNDELFAFVTGKAYRAYGGMRVRVSERLKREYGRERYVSIYGTDAWSHPDGDLITYSASTPKPPRDEPGRFTGPAILLIGPATFSSAMSCAAAAKAYALMRLFGEETAEPMYSTGEIYRLALPKTGFGVYVTTKVFLPPVPGPPASGVVPDVVVRTTRADRRAHQDPVLERALESVG
jgi:Peptidase family S41